GARHGHHICWQAGDDSAFLIRCAEERREPFLLCSSLELCGECNDLLRNGEVIAKKENHTWTNAIERLSVGRCELRPDKAKHERLTNKRVDIRRQGILQSEINDYRCEKSTVR